MRHPVTYEGRRIEIRQFHGQFQADIWDQLNYITSTLLFSNPVAARKRAKAIIDAEDRRKQAA